MLNKKRISFLLKLFADIIQVTQMTQAVIVRKTVLNIVKQNHRMTMIHVIIMIRRKQLRVMEINPNIPIMKLVIKINSEHTSCSFLLFIIIL